MLVEMNEGKRRKVFQGDERHLRGFAMIMIVVDALIAVVCQQIHLNIHKCSLLKKQLLHSTSQSSPLI